MKFLLLLALMSVFAHRDGDFLVVEVPREWQHVEVETDPPADFVPGPEGYRGKTPATSGTVYAALCDDELCTPIEEQFRVNDPFLWLLGCAFACGILMLFMPCSLAAIGLKLAAFRGGSEGSYAAGVLVSFLVLGLMAAFLGAGLSHMSNWWYRAILTVVCYTVALQFLGWLNMPSFGTRAQSPFALGVLSVALGSSCTVPFIAPVLIASTILAAWQTILLFVVMGLGFVSPFLLPIHKLLPKPGAWMVTYERVCGVMMLLVAAWLFSTLPPGSTSTTIPTSGPRVIVVTGDFCLNCKFVHHLWESPAVVQALGDIEVTTLDWSNGDAEITKLLDSYGVRAIPFALVVNDIGEETVLTGIYSEQDILDALNRER